MSKGSSAGLSRRRKYWRKKNKKLRKKHITYIRLVYRDPHEWAIYRVVHCTHKKCGDLGSVASRREGRQLGAVHERRMAVKAARKKLKKESKV